MIKNQLSSVFCLSRLRYLQATALQHQFLHSAVSSISSAMYGGDRGNWGRRGRGGHGHRNYGRGGRGGGHRTNWRDQNEDADGEGASGGSARYGQRSARGRGGDRGRQRDAGEDGAERERPPPGLRGREIGMWYAKRSRGTAAKRDKDQRSEVKLDGHQEQNIRQLLHDIKSSRDCPPQPGRSGARIPDQHSDQREYGDTAENTKYSARQGSARNTGASNMADEPNEDMEDYGNSELPSVTELMQFNAEEDYMVEDDPSVSMMGQDTELNAAIDEELLNDFEEKQQDSKYKKMLQFRKKLPSYEEQHKILKLIRDNQVVVLSGETGCGKTTQVPQFILDDFIERGKGSQCRIICTQPRRISAISVAERVAAERAENCGYSVGYMIRLEHKLPRQDGSILYCTTGILLKVLENDSLLHRATHIILDEIHERDLLSDFLIIILKDILQRRPDLKLILMSATLNAEAFSTYFDNSPMINIPGYTYPVTEYLLEDVVETLRYQVPEKMMKQDRGRGRKKPGNKSVEDEMEEHMDVWLRNLERGMDGRKPYSNQTIRALSCMDLTKTDVTLIKTLIHHIVMTKGDGAILVFVPGWGEISDLHKMLTADPMFNSDSFKIIPLHSMMPTLNQREVFDRPPRGVRKIVIATNIAETSITIDDIVYVIDSGKIKVKDFTPENNLASLASHMVSRANAKQRRGRAGRVQPGECYHLYSSLQESFMLDYLPPEILRTPLEELCLHIKLLKLGEIIPFVRRAMQPPSLAALELAICNLQGLNALDKHENLTPLGKHLARMPLDPHTGKMILFGAMFGCLDPILTIAASLNFKDPFFIPLGKEQDADRARLSLSDGSLSDHILLVNAFQKWESTVSRGTNRSFCWDYFMSESTLRMLKKMRGQLAEVLKDLGFLKFKSATQVDANRHADNPALVKAIVCAGLYPNVGKIKSLPTKRRNMTFRMKDDSRCELHPKSVAKEVQKPLSTQWVVYHKKMKTSSVWLYDCSLISPYSLLFFGGDIAQLKDDGVDTVSVDDWIRFKASPDTVNLVKELRRELDSLLDDKITHTGPTNWSGNKKEGALLQAIINLVTTEDTNSTSFYDDDMARDQW